MFAQRPAFPPGLRPTLFALVISFSTWPLTLRAGLVQDLEAVVDDKMQTYNVPGAIVGIWRGDSELAVFEKGFSSLENSTPISRLDSMRIASVTKSFTVTRILQLAESGDLSLEDPISNYVPGLQNGQATLRQLANMTSGIFNYTEDSTVVSTLFTNPTKIWTDQELVDAANAPIYSPYFAPGTGWHYSNTNTVLLGMVIEAVTGNSYANEISDFITLPLGLTDTYYPPGDTIPAPSSQGYIDIGNGIENFTEVSPTAASASGSLLSRLEDLRLWAEVLATGGPLLDPATQAERLQLVPTAGGVGPEYDGYGLGIGSLDGWLGHTGDFPGFQSLVMYDPTYDQTVVILLNLTQGTHIPTEMLGEMSPLLAIPEPNTIALLTAALAWLGWRATRSRHSASS